MLSEGSCRSLLERQTLAGQAYQQALQVEAYHCLMSHQLAAFAQQVTDGAFRFRINPDSAVERCLRGGSWRVG